jgi:inhibitor of cysteine peptidase
VKAKLILVCAVGVLSFFLFACAPAAKQASVEVSCDDFSQPHISKQVEVATGGTVTVTLCSNPTTGFIWSETAQISDQGVLQQTDHKLVTPESETPPLVGAPGQEVWTFKALKKGTSTVSMEYSRPWEGGEKGVWTFNLTVTVK